MTLTPSQRLAFDAVRDEMKGLSKALTDTKPIVGELDPKDYKDADDVYRIAFEFMGLPKEDYDDVDGSAYPTLFKYASRLNSSAGTGLAGDAAIRRRGTSAFLKDAIGKGR